MKFKLSFLILISLVVASCDSGTIDNPGETPNPQDRLAQIDIDTNGGTIVDEPKINAEMSITVDDQTTFEGFIGIEFRGASSQALFPKKSYGVETRDANNEDLDVALLGFPEEEDWILYGPYSDKSLLRNVIIYDFAREMGMYASRTQLVELSLNNNYQGVYVFMEKLKRDSQRIAINKLTETENTGEDLTGGYILKIDKVSGSNLGSGYNSLNSFTSSYSPLHTPSDKEIRFLYDYPDAEDITSEQKVYISSYVADFEGALASSSFADPTTGYRSFIDVDSFIDFFILNELSNNVDGYRLSTYLHKDKSGKLKMGPIWDFNLAFGNANYCGGDASNVWAYKFNNRCPNDFWVIPFWWERLLEDPTFVTQLKARWNALRGNVLSEGSIFAKINGYTELLEKAQAIDNNFTTWNILGEWIWPNNYVGDTYQDETNYLENFLTDRLNWLDSNINAL